MRNMRHLAACVALLALVGCQAAGGMIGGALLSGAVPVVVQALGVSAPVLSDIAKGACAAQDAANVAAEIAANRGYVAWAAHFAKASQLAGIGCTWL